MSVAAVGASATVAPPKVPSAPQTVGLATQAVPQIRGPCEHIHATIQPEATTQVAEQTRPPAQILPALQMAPPA